MIDIIVNGLFLLIIKTAFKIAIISELFVIKDKFLNSILLSNSLNILDLNTSIIFCSLPISPSKYATLANAVNWI